MVTLTDYKKSIFSPNSHCDTLFLKRRNKFPLPNGLITSNRHIYDELYDLFSITLIDIRPEAIVD